MAKKSKKTKKNGRQRVQPAKLERQTEVQGAVAAGATDVFEPEQTVQVAGTAEGATLEPERPAAAEQAQALVQDAQAIAVQTQVPAEQTPGVAVQAQTSAKQAPTVSQDAKASAQEGQVVVDPSPASITVTLPQREEKTSRSAALFIRLEPADKAALQLCAVRAGMTLAGFCRAILQSVARREGGDGTA